MCLKYFRIHQNIQKGHHNSTRCIQRVQYLYEYLQITWDVHCFQKGTKLLQNLNKMVQNVTNILPNSLLCSYHFGAQVLHGQSNVVGGNGEEALQLRVGTKVASVSLQEGPQSAIAHILHNQNVRFCIENILVKHTEKK